MEDKVDHSTSNYKAQSIYSGIYPPPDTVNNSSENNYGHYVYKSLIKRNYYRKDNEKIGKQVVYRKDIGIKYIQKTSQKNPASINQYPDYSFSQIHSIL